MLKLKNILQEDCWKGYKQYGMKKKGDKQVPNCVPVDEFMKLAKEASKIHGTSFTYTLIESKDV
jgi:hypothetical protein